MRRRFYSCGAALIFGVALLGAGKAHAQVAVSDAIADPALVDIDQTELPDIALVLRDIDKVDTETKISVTVGIQGETFVPIDYGPACQALFVPGLMQEFQGWVPATNTSTLDAKAISDNMMNMYQGAYTDMESLSSLDNTTPLQLAKQNAAATTLLQAVQIGNELQIEVIQELQKLRLAVIAAGTPNIAAQAQALDANARAMAKEECDANPNCQNPEQGQ